MAGLAGELGIERASLVGISTSHVSTSPEVMRALMPWEQFNADLVAFLS